MLSNPKRSNAKRSEVKKCEIIKNQLQCEFVVESVLDMHQGRLRECEVVTKLQWLKLYTVIVMNYIEQKRLALFLFGCIGTRLTFAYIAKTRTEFLPYMAIIAILIGIGLMYYYLSGTRPTGPEVFGEKIWWNHLRPVHATMYFLFAILAIQKNKSAYLFLFADAMIGLAAELNKRVF